MAATYWQHVRMFNRGVRLYMASVLLTGLAVHGIYAVLLNLFLLRLGYGPEFIGAVAAVTAVVRSASCLAAGAVGDRWGSRQAMLWGLTLQVVGLGLVPVAELLAVAAQPGWIMTTNMLTAIGSALYVVNFTPFLMCSTTPEERNHAFSIHSALSPLAGFAGSLVGGLLPGLFAGWMGVSLQAPAPYRYALWLAVLIALPALGFFRGMREVGNPPTREVIAARGPAPWRVMVFMVLIMVLRWAGRGPVTTFFNVYLDAGLHTPVTMVGLLTAMGQLVGVPAALLMPLAMARWGAWWTLVGASLGIGFCMVPLALVPHWSVAGLSFVALTALISLTSPTMTVFSQGLVSPGWRGAMTGVMNMSVGLGTALMAFGGGYAIKILGYRDLFLGGAALSALGGVCLWAYFRVPRRARKALGDRGQEA